MTHETRSQKSGQQAKKADLQLLTRATTAGKSGPTAGEKADLQLVRKSSVNSRQELAPTTNESVNVADRRAHRQGRSCSNYESSRQVSSSDGCQRIVDAHVPQVEEEQTVADVQ